MIVNPTTLTFADLTDTEANEFLQIYGLDVVVRCPYVPTSSFRPGRNWPRHRGTIFSLITGCSR